MKKVYLLFAIVFLLTVCPAHAKEVTASDANATANLVYAPASNSTFITEPEKRELISVNPYAGMLSGTGAATPDIWKPYRKPPLEETINSLDWDKYKVRSENPFKTVRSAFAYFCGQTDTIKSDNFDAWFKNPDDPEGQRTKITFLSQEPTNGAKEIGVASDCSRRREVWDKMIIDTVVKLRKATNAHAMFMKIYFKDMGVVNGNASTIASTASTVIGATGANLDARQLAIGATGTSGETTTTHEWLLSFEVTAYDDTALEKPTQPTEYLVAPLFFDFWKYNIRENEVEKIKPIGDMIYTKMQQEPSKNIYFIGFCDERGEKGLNDTLGINRAMIVRNAIVSYLKETKGMTDQQLRGKLFFTSASKKQHVYEGNTEEIHQLNRRVDVVWAEFLTSLPPLPNLTRK